MTDATEAQLSLEHAIPRLHIEAVIQDSALHRTQAACELEKTLKENYVSLAQDTQLEYDLAKQSIRVIASSGPILRLDDTQLCLYIYQLHAPDEVYFLDFEEQPLARCLKLPAASLDGLWRTLKYESTEVDLQSRLLGYVSSMMLFADRRVDSQVCAFNRCILLHGPPGTGKTSLSRALAQKISIRLSARFTETILIEVQAASLFSKWFSESAKLVNHLFDQIYSKTENEDAFVCVLIDEAESLTRSRSQSLQSNEPGDAMRVVNVLLTQLDRLQARPNVLVMTTSNMLDASDMAFIDRADLSIELDKPGIASTYEILRSCIEELILRGIVTCPSSPELPAYSAVPREVSDPSPFVSYAEAKGHDIGPSAILVAICQHLWSKELGGRALRRLALMAHAWFIQKEEACTLEEFLEALAQAALAKHE